MEKCKIKLINNLKSIKIKTFKTWRWISNKLKAKEKEMAKYRIMERLMIYKKMSSQNWMIWRIKTNKTNMTMRLTTKIKTNKESKTTNKLTNQMMTYHSFQDRLILTIRKIKQKGKKGNSINSCNYH